MLNTSEPLMIKYLHEKGIREGLPVSGTFELTQRCNFNCKMCYVHEKNIKSDPLSTADWLSLASQAKDAGTIFLLLTGGEPLLRDDFEELYVSVIKMGFMVSLNSNGSLIDRYKELFCKYPPLRINISLYGADNSAYERLCKNASFDKVMSNIRLLNEISVPVRLNTVFTPENVDDCKKIIDISKELNVLLKPTAYSYPQIRLDKGSDTNGRFSPEEAAECMVNTDSYRFNKEEFIRRAERIVSLPEGFKENKVRCRAGRSTFWITADGIMRPCGMMPCPDAYPLKDGFNSAWQQTKKSTNEIRLPVECLSCKYSGICNICAAMCIAETGDFGKKPEYICRLTESIYRLTENSLKENDYED